MPQAMEWSLATPMINPRLPSINLVIRNPGRSSARTAKTRPWERLTYSYVNERRSSVQALEHHRGIGATKAERIRQHAAELGVVLALAHDWHIGESRIER